MRVIVVGCGVVGAAIAYELSQVSGLAVTVLDRQLPAQASTGAALGVLMGAISQKTKGKNLTMRLSSIRRYNDWVPELEALTGQTIPFNQQGILRLCFEGEDLTVWKTLAEIRQTQGWRLELYDRVQLANAYPYINFDRVIGAVYSPDDRQIDPTALTLALVAAAKRNGTTFNFDAFVTGISSQPASNSSNSQICRVHTQTEALEADWLVIAAGLGSTALTVALQQPVDIRPVLGQAIRLRLEQPLGNPQRQPVITGDDCHIVPLGGGEYWIGATVEFATHSQPLADAAVLDQVIEQAIALCPDLNQGTIIHRWSGLRPRPEGRPAPIVEPLPGYSNVSLATGHYRNGVLLAPATAELVRSAIVHQEPPTPRRYPSK